MLSEIEDMEQNEGSANRENCHLVNSVLLENFRCFPVADTLPHQATEDVIVGGYFIKKGSGLQGSLTAIMNDPENFKNPDLFIPDRFIKNGKFEKDIRV